MTSPNYRVRRATLDDIGQLTSLWQSMALPVEELARRITEFQITEGVDGKVLGAIGLQIAQRHGRIHSEGFTDFALADHLRPLLWESTVAPLVQMLREIEASLRIGRRPDARNDHPARRVAHASSHDSI